MFNNNASWLSRALCATAILAVALVAVAPADHVTAGNAIDFVPIGNPGNSNDPARPYGAVSYPYSIGKTGVSIAQWEEFYLLDPAVSGRTINDFNGNYNYWNTGSYSVGVDAPVAFVSLNNAAQYANWLTSGNAMSGAYTIDSVSGAITAMMSREDILATGNLYYLVPTHDEWYKAAYFKPDGTGYTLYANGLDTAPPKTTDGSTGWNYGGALSPPMPWTVDSGDLEQNGTLNMNGNMNEFTQTERSTNRYWLRGGSYGNTADYLAASIEFDHYATSQFAGLGFRLVVIPDPGPITFIPGDASKDGVVDESDATILAANWLASGVGWDEGDFNNDGVVNDVDATLMATNWQVTAPGASVPEPGTFVLLAGMATLLLWRRKR